MSLLILAQAVLRVAPPLLVLLPSTIVFLIVQLTVVSQQLHQEVLAQFTIVWPINMVALLEPATPLEIGKLLSTTVKVVP